MLTTTPADILDYAVAGGLTALQRKLAVMADPVGEIDAAELVMVLRQCGAHVSEEDGNKLAAEYGALNTKKANTKLFLAALQAVQQQ